MEVAYSVGYRIFHSDRVLLVKSPYKVTITQFLEYQFKDTVSIEKVTVALHLNISLIRLILAGLNFSDEKVLALSERFFDHLIEGSGEYGIYFT
jgi:hypothetical protein